MKDKIILALKAKFPKLSDARIAAYAAKLEPKIKEEKDIEDKITDLDEIVDFASIIKQDAKVAKLEAEKKEAGKKKTEEPKDDEDEEEEPAEPGKKHARVPAWAKSILESNKALTDKIAAIESKESQSTIKQKLADKLKDIPASYWGEWKQPESEDGMDEFVTKVTTGFEGFTQDFANKGFSNMSKPKGGSGGSGTKEASKEEIKSVLNLI